MVIASTFNFTTGPAPLPDVGELSYNGCTFSPLFTTEVSGTAIKDDAQRTTKYMEYVIKVDGYVTMPDTSASIRFVMRDLRKLLSEQGGALTYKGRGCDIVVNSGSDLDVAWGPVPDILEFQPLGGGSAAKIVWRVKVCVNEQKKYIAKSIPVGGGGGILGGKVPVLQGLAADMLQFNYSTSVSYGEDGFSKLDVTGVLEIPLTRIPNQKTRTLQQTADSLRNQIDTRIMKGIDLNHFRVVNRSFNLSKDKRTLDWNISAEEIPYQQMPPDCTVAHGSYSVRPAKAGMGLCLWLCNLRATYTVRADKPRRVAWHAFHALLRKRMSFATRKYAVFQGIPKKVLSDVLEQNDGRVAFLVDFSMEEGLYLDSKSVTFSATWRLITMHAGILRASGLWTKVDEKKFANDKENLWAISMKNVQGSESWLPNRTNPNDDIIVDFGM